jgi:hypothetical protein
MRSSPKNKFTEFINRYAIFVNRNFLLISKPSAEFQPRWQCQGSVAQNQETPHLDPLPQRGRGKRVGLALEIVPRWRFPLPFAKGERIKVKGFLPYLIWATRPQIAPHGTPLDLIA